MRQAFFALAASEALQTYPQAPRRSRPEGPLGKYPQGPPRACGGRCQTLLPDSAA